MNIVRVQCLFVLLILFFQHLSAQPFAAIDLPKGNKYKWLPEWNGYVAEEIRNNKQIFLNDEVVPKADINELCPGYFTASEDEKVSFWVLFVASMAYFESGFKANARFKEPPPIEGIYSEGLLQLSYVDESNHRDLGIYISKQRQNILDPKVNLQSGVKILGKQIRLKKVLFTSKNYYWSILTKKKKEVLGFFKKHSTALSFCK